MNARQMAREIWREDAEAALLVVADSGGVCGLSAIEEELDGDRSAASRAAQRLRALGLAEDESSLAREVTITRFGRQTAAEVTISRARGWARFDAVQRGILEWLADNKNQSDLDQFVGTEGATAFGVPFTVDEVREQGDYLDEQGLIHVIRVYGPELLRPTLQPRGLQALHADGTIREYAEGLGGGSMREEGNTTNIHAVNVGGVQTGDGNVQNIAQNITSAESVQVRERVDAILSAVSDVEGAEPLRGELVEIRAEAVAGAEKPRLRERAREALVLGTMNDIGPTAMKWLGELVRFLSN